GAGPTEGNARSRGCSQLPACSPVAAAHRARSRLSDRAGLPSGRQPGRGRPRTNPGYSQAFARRSAALSLRALRLQRQCLALVLPELSSLAYHPCHYRRAGRMMPDAAFWLLAVLAAIASAALTAPLRLWLLRRGQ